MIMIPSLLLNFSMNYGVFLALKPVPPLHFTLIDGQSECTNHTFEYILHAHIQNNPLSV